MDCFYCCFGAPPSDDVQHSFNPFHPEIALDSSGENIIQANSMAKSMLGAHGKKECISRCYRKSPYQYRLRFSEAKTNNASRGE